MTPLRQEMIEAMQLRQFSNENQAAYLQWMIKLAKHYNKSPEKITEKEAQDFVLHLAHDRKYAWSTCNIVVSSMRFFYGAVLRQSKEQFYVPLAKTEQRLPDILSHEEVNRLLSCARHIKYQLTMMAAYGAGLGITEVANLRLSDIYTDAMVICVRQGKRKKYRYVPLPIRLLEVFNDYRQQYQLTDWLFPGLRGNKPINTRTIRREFDKAKVKANITKDVTFHGLRHAFATHLLDAGTDLLQLKQLLGHGSLSSTLRYTRISRKTLSHIQSPLDMIA